MKKTIKLLDLDCGHCADKIQNAVKKIDGVTSVSVNFLGQKMVLEAPDDQFDAVLAEAKALIGYLPELPPLYQEMTVQEYLDFAAELKGIKKKAERKEQVLRAARRTGLEDVLPRLIRSLSKGYRQRVGIAQALLGAPQLIILDEPTVGLDPAQVIEIRRLIRELGKSHTVILSSHILSEVKAVCDKALILSQGHLAAVVDLTEEQRDLEELFLALTAPEAASDKKED
mgnify:CR=1 FL=1